MRAKVWQFFPVPIAIPCKNRDGDTYWDGFCIGSMIRMSNGAVAGSLFKPTPSNAFANRAASNPASSASLVGTGPGYLF